MTIRNKFTALAWIVGCVLFGVTLISFITNRFLINANNDIYRESTRGIEHISITQHLLSDARNMEIMAVSYAAVANVERLGEVEKEFTSQKELLLASLSDIGMDEKQRDELKKQIINYFDAATLTFERARQYVTDEAARNITENSRAPFAKMDEYLNRLMDSKVKTAAEQNKKAVTYATISRALLIIAMITASGLIAYLIIFRKSIVEPVNRMSVFVKNIAEGDLNNTIKIESKDEIGDMGRALKDMSAYLRDMARTAEEIAEGDLRSDAAPKSEKDVLGNSFRKMITGLRGLITEIKTGSGMLAVSATQIAASADQTSRNSETSASAVEEMTATMHEMSTNIQNVAKHTQKQLTSVTQTASSVEQMVASMRLVAENVKRLVSISDKSREAVSAGSVAVNKAAVGMTDINAAIQQSAQTIMNLGAKTEDMARIVEVIDDIAEQTNLLALNAAIEAAKAGDQGLGFAVVADEVRKLAERSALSTREIADLIKSISKEAQGSVDNMVKSTGIVEVGLVSSKDVIKALEGIKTAVEEVSRYSNEIGVATQEQSSGSEQIGKAMVNLNEVTQEISSASGEQSTGTDQVVRAIEKVREMVQQNASGAIELAASAEQLSKHAGSLRGMVEKFSLNGHGKAA